MEKSCYHTRVQIFDSIIIKLGQDADIARMWLMGQGSDLGPSWPSCLLSLLYKVYQNKSAIFMYFVVISTSNGSPFPDFD
jgi:hypothetical protein